MKKKKIFIFTVIPIVLILSVLLIFFYLLTPADKKEYYSSNEKKSLTEVIFSVSEFKLKNTTIELNLDEENINNIVASIGTLDKYKIELNTNEGHFYMPVDTMKIFHSQVDVKFDIEADNNRLVINIKESRLGKMKIDNKNVLDYITEGTYNDTDISKQDNKLCVSNKYFYFQDAFIKDNKIYIKCRPNLKEIIRSIPQLIK